MNRYTYEQLHPIYMNSMAATDFILYEDVEEMVIAATGFPEAIKNELAGRFQVFIKDDEVSWDPKGLRMALYWLEPYDKMIQDDPIDPVILRFFQDFDLPTGDDGLDEEFTNPVGFLQILERLGQ